MNTIVIGVFLVVFGNLSCDYKQFENIKRTTKIFSKSIPI